LPILWTEFIYVAHNCFVMNYYDVKFFEIVSYWFREKYLKVRSAIFVK